MRTLFIICMCVSSLPIAAQQNDDLQKQINQLNETNKAILKELQEIRKVLESQRAPQQAAAPVPDTLPAEPIDVTRDQFRGAPNAKVAIIEYSDYAPSASVMRRTHTGRSAKTTSTPERSSTSGATCRWTCIRMR